MFGSSGSPTREGAIDESAVASQPPNTEFGNSIAQSDGAPLPPWKAPDDIGDRKSQSPRRSSAAAADGAGSGEKKRRSSGVSSKASSLLASAKNSLHFSQNPNSRDFMKGADSHGQTPLQKLGKQDPALSVPQGQHNNSAGESHPGPRSTFRVGVWEDKNKKCRRTMEDTHAFLYNFLHTPAPALKDASTPATTTSETSLKSSDEASQISDRKSSSNSALTSAPSNSSFDMMETDNGYFAIFDGHAGTFAADWCGKKLHIILEEMIRKNPNTPIPELLDQTFTNVDAQLEKLPLKNSGCTAVTAVLRWEDRIPNSQSATGSTAIAPATAAAVKAQKEAPADSEVKPALEDSASSATTNDVSMEETKKSVPALNTSSLPPSIEATHAKLKSSSSRQRVLYTANVGDARIVLCRNGKALRLSYDHKGSDENEGKRVAAAGGLILNNRVNGVLAVTRALGDAYMKDLVTGHPYTTETVIQPDLDEFIILACDGVSTSISSYLYPELLRNSCLTHPSYGTYVRIKRQSISSVLTTTRCQLQRSWSNTPSPAFLPTTSHA